MKPTLKVVCVFGLICGLLVIRSPAFAQDIGDEDPMTYDPSDDTTTVNPGAWDSNLANSLLSQESFDAAIDGIADSSTPPTTDSTPAPTALAAPAPAPAPASLAAHQHRSPNHSANHAGHRSAGNHAGHRSSGTTANHAQHDHHSSGRHQ